MMVPQNNFTLLRLVLAVLVVLGHFKILSGATSPGIFGYADFAVDAFFIISGYLVYGSFDKDQNIGGFYIRRFFRIYPLYAFVIITQGLAMYVLADSKDAPLGELPRYLTFNLMFANFAARGFGSLLMNLHNHGINPSLWTLKIEVAFYAVLPLLWYLTRRYGLVFLLLIYAMSTWYFAVMLQHDAFILAKQLPGKIRFFAIGMGLYRYRDHITLSLLPAFGIAILLFIFCSLRQHLPDALIIPFYPLAIGMLVFICALRLPAIPLKFDISYGVYLLHGPLIQFALLLHFYQDTVFFLFQLLCTVLILAFIAELLIEKPMVEWGYWFSSRWMQRHRREEKP